MIYLLFGQSQIFITFYWSLELPYNYWESFVEENVCKLASYLVWLWENSKHLQMLPDSQNSHTNYFSSAE